LKREGRPKEGFVPLFIFLIITKTKESASLSYLFLIFA
jgi:hypothetical protein